MAFFRVVVGGCYDFLLLYIKGHGMRGLKCCRNILSLFSFLCAACRYFIDSCNYMKVVFLNKLVLSSEGTTHTQCV